MKITQAGFKFRGRGNAHGEYFPGFGVTTMGKVEDFIDESFKAWKERNKLKVRAMNKYHGSGENHLRYRTRNPT